MKKIFTYAVLLVAVVLTSVNATSQEIIYSDDKVFIEDFEIAPGESKLVTVWMSSSYSWSYMWSVFEMPKGLEFEVLSPEDVDTGEFSLEAVYDAYTPDRQLPKDECMTAISTNFANTDFWSQKSINYYKNRLGKNYCSWLRFYNIPINDVNEDGTPYRYNGSVVLNFINDDLMTFNGTYKIALLKVRATDELEDESFIKFHQTLFIGKCHQPVLGTEVDCQVYAEAVQTRVKRAPGTSAISEVAATEVGQGDGLYYDMQGRAMTEPAGAGIYVRNGKKIVVR